MISTFSNNFYEFCEELTKAIDRQSPSFVVGLISQKIGEFSGKGNSWNRCIDVGSGTLSLGIGLKSLSDKVVTRLAGRVSSSSSLSSIGKDFYNIGMGAALITNAINPSPASSIILGIGSIMGGIPGVVGGLNQIKRGFYPSDDEHSNKWAKVAGGIVSTALGCLSINAGRKQIEHGLPSRQTIVLEKQKNIFKENSDLTAYRINDNNPTIVFANNNRCALEKNPSLWNRIQQWKNPNGAPLFPTVDDFLKNSYIIYQQGVATDGYSCSASQLENLVNTLDTGFSKGDYSLPLLQSFPDEIEIENFEKFRKEYIKLNPKETINSIAQFMFTDARNKMNTLESIYYYMLEKPHDIGVISTLKNSKGENLFKTFEEFSNFKTTFFGKENEFNLSILKNYSKEQITLAKWVEPNGDIANLLQAKKDVNGVIAIATADHNGAFQASSSIEKTLLKNFNLYGGKIGKPDEICSILQDARSRAGKPLDVLFIGGHGNPRVIKLGNEGLLHTNNLENVAGCIKENLSKDAPIILRSCATGEKRFLGLPNLAEHLSKATGHRVMAPTDNSFGFDCNIKVDDISHQITSYSCMKDPAQQYHRNEPNAEYGQIFQSKKNWVDTISKIIDLSLNILSNLASE